MDKGPTAPVGPWTDVRTDAQRLAYLGSWANTEVKGHDQANSVRRAADRRKAIIVGQPSAGDPSPSRAGDGPRNVRSRRDRGRRIRRWDAVESRAGDRRRIQRQAGDGHRARRSRREA